MDIKTARPGSTLKDVNSMATKPSPNIRVMMFQHVISLIDNEKGSTYDMLTDMVLTP